MPPTNANDPSRTSDPDPTGATPDRDVAVDLISAPPPLDGATATHLPGHSAKPAATQSERPAATVSVPGYQIESILGRGGMGVVYKALHLSLKRTVALKMILAGGHAGPRELARFRTEAEAVARLQHPNIVQIHEIGEARGHPYCALEFVEGGTLADKLNGQPMPPRDAARLVEVLARAMQLAHSRNIVHRDLKPANILLAADGTPKITDFGLARHLDSDSNETQPGTVMGTASYMAPEQASGHAHEAGPAADIYSLGAILYDCLTGRPPFRGATVVETLDQVRAKEPTAPSSGTPAYPWTWTRSASSACVRSRSNATPPPRNWPTNWRGTKKASRSWRVPSGASSEPSSGSNATPCRPEPPPPWCFRWPWERR